MGFLYMPPHLQISSLFSARLNQYIGCEFRLKDRMIGTISMLLYFGCTIYKDTSGTKQGG
jgi:hypothetical protein